MVFDLKFPPELAAKLEAAAQRLNLGAEEWIVIAAAEKLARMEHEQWLDTHGNGGPGADAGRNDRCQDKKP